MNDTNTNLFNKYITTLNTSDPYQNKIANFCASLSENHIHTRIKLTFIEHSQYVTHITNHTTIYEKVLNYIYTNNLTDFTITFKDNIKCSYLKVILEQIPFFKMMFEEFKINDVTLDVPSHIADPVIKLMYNLEPPLKKIDKNFLEMFKLVDKWLLDGDDTFVLLDYLLKNLDINDFIDNGQFDDLIVLTNHVSNMSNIPNSLLVTKTITHILNKFHLVMYDFKDIMFKFDNWPNIFTDEQKLKAIEMTKNYELLNVSKIEPNAVIYVLKISTLTEIDIYDMFESSNIFICFKGLQKPDKEYDSIINIESYYPNFKATIFSKTNTYAINGGYDIKRSSVMGPYQFIKVELPLINSDTNIDCNNWIQYSYKITDITLEVNGQIIHKKIYRKGFKCKVIVNNHNAKINGQVWIVNKIDHNITI